MFADFLTLALAGTERTKSSRLREDQSGKVTCSVFKHSSNNLCVIMIIIFNMRLRFFYSSRLLANISAVSPNRSSSFVLSEISGRVLRLPAAFLDSSSFSLPSFLGG